MTEEFVEEESIAIEKSSGHMDGIDDDYDMASLAKRGIGTEHHVGRADDLSKPRTAAGL